MDVDPVRIHAQATVDAIDKQIEELSHARESLVRMFGLGIRIPAPKPPEPEPEEQPVKVNYMTNAESNLPRTREQEERWNSLRHRVLTYLKIHGPTDRGVLRQKLDIGGRTSFKVMSHGWFSLVGRTYSLSPDGEDAASRMGI